MQSFTPWIFILEEKIEIIEAETKNGARLLFLEVQEAERQQVPGKVTVYTLKKGRLYLDVGLWVDDANKSVTKNLYSE